MAIDLSVEIKTGRGSIVLRNPLLPGSSEVAADETTIRRCIDNGIGGIVTKSAGHLSTPPPVLVTSKPWAFPLDRFGPEYKGAWLLQAGYFTEEENFEKLMEKAVPKWYKICHDAGVPLINSIVELGWEMEAEEIAETWARVAKRLEEAGSDAIELDASCPASKTTFAKGDKPVLASEELWADLEYAGKIISRVMQVTTVPIGAKLSLFHNPVALHAKVWAEKGLNFISGHNVLPSTGVFIDIEKEEVYGTPGETMYIAGPTMVPLSLNRLSYVLRAVDVPVIGGAGVYKPSDVIQYLLLGCSAVQVTSGVYYKGHKIYKELLEGIEDWMKRHGYTRIDQFRGKLLEEASCLRSEWEEKYGYKMQPAEKGKEFKYLLLGGKSPSPVVPRFDIEKCTLCDVCDDTCLYGVIKVDHEKKTLNIDEDLCMGCGMCIGICPENPGALWLEDKRTGEVVWDGVGMVKSFKKKDVGGYSLA
jgi:dihydropyrimidine dehydrogenase (NAD+) subunit PreA